MIRVAANLAWLTPGGVGGSEEYAVRLLEGVIAAAPTDIELEIHGSDALRAAHPTLSEVPFHVVPGPLHKRSYRLVAESAVVFRRTRHADVVHHFGGRVPVRRHGNDVVTIHDLQPLELPENFSKLKTAYLAWALPRSARSAGHICVPSEWVADGVARRFDVPREHITAVSSTHNGQEAIDPSIGAALGSGPVVLYPAMTHPHKNHRVLLQAMEILSVERPDVCLVLTGAPGRVEDEIVDMIAATAARVVRPGRVSAAALRGLYERADVVAFPSRYEGFGLPVLEAFAHSTPVVAANSTALPEVVGDAGTLVDPDDAAAWSGAIERAIEQTRDGTVPVALMKSRLAAYAPARAAERLMDVWRSLPCDPMQVSR